MADYAHPEVLVTTEWLQDHLADDSVRILEVDYDPSSAYELGHIPGSALVDWKRDINDTVRRDILSREQFDRLLSRVGATPDTTLVLYGDMRNWFAAFAFWTFAIYGHVDIRLLNGGRRKWFEEGRPTTEDVPSFAATEYRGADADTSLRAFLPDVRTVIGRDDFSLVDVRSPPSSRERSPRRRSTPTRVRSAPGTSREPPTSRGRRQSRTTTPSSRSTSCVSSTPPRESPATTR